MLEVKVAVTAGFCPGVKRAVDKVYALIGERDNPIYTLGPIIHNESVVSDLESKGVRSVELRELSELPKNSTIVIRSHGVGREVYRTIESHGLEWVDVTCTFVKKIHRIVEEKSREGYHIVIIGDASHPEVMGICGWCEAEYTVLKTLEEAEKFEIKDNSSLCIVSQTTFNYNKFEEIVDMLQKKCYNVIANNFIVLNTICNATEKRQREARSLASEVDTMLVVGGRHSSNTQKLFEICERECGNTYYIQTPVDLDSDMFQYSSCVGITAGASTPKKIIEEVQTYVRNEF